MGWRLDAVGRWLDFNAVKAFLHLFDRVIGKGVSQVGYVVWAITSGKPVYQLLTAVAVIGFSRIC